MDVGPHWRLVVSNPGTRLREDAVGCRASQLITVPPLLRGDAQRPVRVAVNARRTSMGVTKLAAADRSHTLGSQLTAGAGQVAPLLSSCQFLELRSPTRLNGRRWLHRRSASTPRVVLRRSPLHLRDVLGVPSRRGAGFSVRRRTTRLPHAEGTASSATAV